MYSCRSRVDRQAAATDLGLVRSADVEDGDTITGGIVELDGDPGVASRLTDLLQSLANDVDGTLTIRSESIDTRLEDLQSRIEKIVNTQKELSCSRPEFWLCFKDQ